MLIPRKYQEDIYNTCKDNNTLVILPTGLGKTLVALMLAKDMLKDNPKSKIVFLAPTKPLAEQHLEYFKEHLDSRTKGLQLFTGKINAVKRKALWKTSRIIFSTPQCIENDLKKENYNLKSVCLLVEDECHRCLKNYSYTYVAQKYLEQAKKQRILGLTASPGVEEEKIKLILSNLNMERIELRTRNSPDVIPYLQDLDSNKIDVEFPARFEEIRRIIKVMFDVRVAELRAMGLLLGATMKTSILMEQKRISATLKSDPNQRHLYWAMSLCAQCIRLDHSLELLETQSLLTFKDFIDDTFTQALAQKTKAVQVIAKLPEFLELNDILTRLLNEGMEHPKMDKILNVIQHQREKNPDFKAIVFSQFRTSAGAIAKYLNSKDIPASVFVGQSKKTTTFGQSGSNQKEQQQIVVDFKEGRTKVLCATSIAEEGLDIPEVNAVIFFEPIPSAIRTIQRTGRTARLMKGSLYILVCKGTRDEAYYYASKKKELKMYESIEKISDDLKSGRLTLASLKEPEETTSVMVEPTDVNVEPTGVNVDSSKWTSVV